MRGGPARRRGGGRGAGPLLPRKLAKELGLPQAVRRGGAPPHRGRDRLPRGAGVGAGEVGCRVSSIGPCCELLRRARLPGGLLVLSEARSVRICSALSTSFETLEMLVRDLGDARPSA